LQLGIDDRYIAPGVGSRQVKARAGQPLIEKPDASSVTAGRLLANERFDRSGAGFQKQTLEDGEVEAFVLEGEGQMAFQGGRWRMARRHDSPAVALDDTVAFADGGQGSRQRDRERLMTSSAGARWPPHGL
jgi:hypothetical protein